MRLLAVTALLITLAAPSVARAAWFGVEPIDGPNTAIVGLGGVDLANDGTGGLVYLRGDAGGTHVFLSRLSGGAWQFPLRVDAGVGASATAVRVAAADGGVLLVAWIAGGTVYGSYSTPGHIGGPVALGGGATTLDADLGVDAAGWVVWSAGGHVRAASVRAGRWHVLPQAIDVLGAPAGPPRVAVGADGSGLATWVEAVGASTHVVARRLTPRMSIPPADLTVPGGSASEPDPVLQYDANFGWVVFREDSGGVPRTFARHYGGSAFGPAVALAGGEPSQTPLMALSGVASGSAVEAGGGNAVLWSQLRGSRFKTPLRLDAGGSAVLPGPVVSVADDGDTAVAWLARPAGGVATVEARERLKGKSFSSEARLSDPARGTAAPGGYAIASDRAGDVAVAVVQGPDGGRLVGAAVWDQPPPRPTLRPVKTFPRRGRPRFQWRARRDLWGPVTYEVQVDDKPIGRTTRTSFVAPRRLRHGRRHWRVVAIDRRGQTVRSARAMVRIPRRK